MPPSKARPDGGGPTMLEATWNPWKMTAIGMALIAAAAVIMGLLMADWGPRAELEALLSPAVTPAAPAAAPAGGVAPSPSPADVQACNQYAKAQAGDKAIRVVEAREAAQVGEGPGKGTAVGGMVIG